jgi:hypothetical protein
MDRGSKDGRFFVTRNLDFSDLRRFEPGTHAGILLLRLRDPARQRLIERTMTLLSSADAHDWSACFVVATDFKVRVRRPPTRT